MATLPNQGLQFDRRIVNSRVTTPKRSNPRDALVAQQGRARNRFIPTSARPTTPARPPAQPAAPQVQPPFNPGVPPIQPPQQPIQTVSTGTPGSIPSGGGFALAPRTVVDRAPDFNDLRSTTFQPGASGPNTFDQQAQTALGGASISKEFDPQTARGREMMMAAMQGLQGPDRLQMAKEAFDIFRQEGQPQFDMDLRNVGKRASALGRVGAGMTTNDLTGVMGQRENRLGLERRRLINQAGQQTLDDRRNILSSLGGATGQLGSQAFQRESGAAGMALGRANAFGQMGQNQFGRELSGRNEQRSERGFQQDMAQQAINNRLQQSLLEEQLRGGAHGRSMQEMQLAGQLGGLGQNPLTGFQAATQGFTPTGPSSFDVGRQALANRPVSGPAIAGPAIASRPQLPPQRAPQRFRPRDDARGAAQ